MNCQEIENLLDQLVLEMLDPATQERLAQHLRQCPQCRRLAQEYGQVTDLLPHALGSASPHRPPASLKSELMSMVQASAEVQAHRMETAQKRPSKPAAPTLRRAGFLPIHLIFNRRLWFGSLVVSGAAIVLLIAFSVFSNWQLEQARQDYAALQEQQRMALQVMNSTRTVEIGLLPTASESPAYGKVLIRPDLDTVVVLANHLPEPPLGRAYHLWVTTRGLQQLAGILDVNSNGFGVLVFHTNRKGPIFKAIELTLQPENSGLPSGDRVLAWESRPNEMTDDLTLNIFGNRYVRDELNGPGTDSFLDLRAKDELAPPDDTSSGSLPKRLLRRSNTD